MIVPFNRPNFTGHERQYIEEALTNEHISSDGPFTRRCAELLAAELGLPRVMLTTSCTDALELSALLLDLQPGDEVIMPSFTFVSTANAYALRGARPVFVDIRPDTWNIDERLIEQAITPRTKAIVVVHYAGIGCEMEAIGAVARKHGLTVIEDNAHGLFGTYRGRPLGSFGSLSTLSFHETKNLSCGEGGALCLADAKLIERAEIIHAKGTNRARYLRGQVDKYTWVEVGSSFGLSDLLAAVLWGQLEQRARILARRRTIFERYLGALQPLSRRAGLQLPIIPEGCTSSYHMFAMLLPTLELRDALIAYLKAKQIYAVFHYVPLHTSERGAALGYKPGQLPISENVSSRLVRLPFFTTLSDDEQTRAIDAVLAFAGQSL
jgi:dTDP-4-amino-4,6-dideoxygalactose transaminase